MAPYTHGLAARPARSRGSSAERPSGLVLIIGNNDVVQRRCRRFCDLVGLSFEEARDSAEAIEAVRRTRFDLILMISECPATAA